MHIVVVTHNSPYIKDFLRSMATGITVPNDVLLSFDNEKDINDFTNDFNNDSGLKVITVISKKLHAISRAMSLYGDDVYILYMESTCTYPVHIISEYINNIPDLERGLKEKLPDNKGSIYGLAGVIMVADKQKNLEYEFQKLLGNDLSHESRNIIGYVRENATVDFLETHGSLLIPRVLLKDDFLDYLSSMQSDMHEDIVLSNYFAKHQILRTQICNLVINRYMMYRSGCLKNYAELSIEEKKEQYVHTVKKLRYEGNFHVY